MKVTVIDSATNVRHRATVAGNRKYVTIERCPVCGAEPGEVAGIRGTQSHDHDTYRAEAATICCDTRLGTIEMRVSTVFGIDEDEAVLNGRPRVY